MATNFPTSIQDLDATRGTGSDPLSSPNHATHHQTEDDTIEALQAKVGVDNSAVTTSLDYKLKNSSSVSPGHKHTLTATDFTDVNITSIADGEVLTYNAGTSKWINSATSAPDASTTVKGVSKLSVAPASASNPIAVGDNDGRVPTQSENDALVGTGTPSSSDPFLNVSTLTGSIAMYAGRSTPTGWLLCDGSAVSRTTYANLFNILNASIGTFTITIASPGLVTLTSHGLATGDSIYLTTTGALPTGLSVNTRYWVVINDANSFWLSTSLANALASTRINTSGSQSGTHTARNTFGVGDGSTTFNVPDIRGLVAVGKDQSQTEFAGLGQTGGAKTHTLTTAEMPSHDHTTGVGIGGGGGIVGIGGYQSGGSTGGPFSVSSTGSSSAHNNLQPYIALSYIIKT